MGSWILQGLRTGIVTTRYPDRQEPQPEGILNRLVVDPERCRPAEPGDCAASCPTGAITVSAARFRLDLGLCIQCTQCLSACPRGALAFEPDYELAVRDRQDLITEVGT